LTLPTTSQPLTGVRVLDLSAVLSGPLATALLADQGADVIKVEPPGGDQSRRIGPAKGDLSAMFITANRGKRSIVLDLKRKDHLAVLRDLAGRADVLVENFRPGAMARLSLDAATLCAAHPRLIYASITGFGPSGPYAGGRVYDAVIQAVSGMSASHPSQATGEPTLLATTVCDKLTGLTAAQAICAALYARERTGQGTHLQLAMLDAALAFQWPDAMNNHLFVTDPPAAFPEFGIHQRPYRTRNGHVAAMTPQPDEFVALCKGLGHPELAADPRFADSNVRRRHVAELLPLLDALAAELLAQPVDVIVVGPPQALRALHKATSTVPIVMANVSNAVGNRFVASLARPGGNITGITAQNEAVLGKLIEQLHAAAPQARRIAVLVNESNPSHGAFWEAAQAACATLGLVPLRVVASAPDRIDAALAQAQRERAQAIVVVADAMFLTERDRLAALIGAARLPSAYGLREHVVAGGLLSYAADIAQNYRDAAVYVDKILRGAKPADLPVAQPTRYQLVLNLKTAGTLGLTLPQSLLLRADEVIE